MLSWAPTCAAAPVANRTKRVQTRQSPPDQQTCASTKRRRDPLSDHPAPTATADQDGLRSRMVTLATRASSLRNERSLQNKTQNATVVLGNLTHANDCRAPGRMATNFARSARRPSDDLVLITSTAAVAGKLLRQIRDAPIKRNFHDLWLLVVSCCLIRTEQGILLRS